MPTAVRRLVHGMNSKTLPRIKATEFRIKNKEPLYIDRPIDIAIFEFAPGAEKTKDKQIHQSIGFTSKILQSSDGKGPKVHIGWRADNESNFYIQQFIIEHCKNCGYSVSVPFSDNEFQVRSAQSDNVGCPACQSPLRNDQNPNGFYSIVKAYTPAEFRTNFEKGRDAKIGGEIIVSRPLIFTPGRELADEVQVDNFTISISANDETLRMNDNGGKLFTGSVSDTHHKHQGDQFERQWIYEGAENIQDRFYINRSNNTLESIALVAQKRTEVIRIAPKYNQALSLFEGVGYGQTAAIKAAYFSAAFIIQRTFADYADIDPMEIEIADVVRKIIDEADQKYVREIVLCDELANGSGFVNRLYRLIVEDGATLKNLLFMDGQSYYEQSLINEEHANKCRSSCYDCLKVYRNMQFHDLLDWELGVSLINVLMNPDYVAGLNLDLSSPANLSVEMRRFYEDAVNYRNLLINDLGSGIPFINQGIPYFDYLDMFTQEIKRVVIIHPLWNVTINGFMHNLAPIVDPTKKMIYLDTFNLKKRYSACYKKIIE